MFDLHGFYPVTDPATLYFVGSVVCAVLAVGFIWYAVRAYRQ